MSDEEILREIGANDYREETKATLIEHIRTADAENTRAWLFYTNPKSRMSKT